MTSKQLYLKTTKEASNVNKDLQYSPRSFQNKYSIPCDVDIRCVLVKSSRLWVRKLKMRAARADQSQLPQRWNYSFYKAAHKIWNVNQSALNCIWIRVGRLFAFLFMEYFHNFFLNSASLICNILRSNKQIRHNFCNTSHLCWHGGQTGPHTAAPSPPCFNSQHILQRRPPPIYESQPPSRLSVLSLAASPSSVSPSFTHPLPRLSLLGYQSLPGLAARS